jgi:uncharacterized membrane protein YdjX (TVP38/TMEM64 family)
MTVPRVVRMLLVGGAVAAVVLALWRWNPWQGVTLDSVRTLVDAWGPLGPLVFMAIMVAGFFVPGPELVLVGAGGLLFGPVWGVVYAWIAAMIGTTAAFLLVRYTAQAWAQRALQQRFPRLRALDQRLHHNGFVLVLVLRVLLFLSPPLNWALGASRVRMGDYALGTALGILPMMGLAVVLAHRVANAESVAAMLDRDILLPGAAFVGLLVLGLTAGRRLLAGSSHAGEEPGGGEVDGGAAGQHAAVERGQHGRRRGALRQTKEPGQGAK